MPYTHFHRDQYRRRSSRRVTKLWVAWAAIAAVSALVVFMLANPQAARLQTVRSILQSAKALAQGSGQAAASRVKKGKIYPYSIIAGGVRSKQQFEEAMRTDPVAAAHYANFNPAKFHLVKLQHAEEAYVSFRVGDNVYWTSHKVKLSRGAVLISDGKHVGRSRCGNQVSETPRLPTYNHEPSARELNTPVEPIVRTEAFVAGPPVVPGLSVLPLMASMPSQPLFPGPGPRRLASTTPPTTTPFIGTPFFTPPLGCSNGKGKPAGDCVTTNTSPPPPTPTPEDGVWVFFLTGAAMVGGCWKMRTQSSKSA